MAILNRRPMTTSETGKWRPSRVGLLGGPAQQAQQASQQQRSHSGSFQRGRCRKEGESSGGNCRFQLRIILSPNLWNTLRRTIMENDVHIRAKWEGFRHLTNYIQKRAIEADDDRTGSQPCQCHHRVLCDWSGHRGQLLCRQGSGVRRPISMSS